MVIRGYSQGCYRSSSEKPRCCLRQTHSDQKKRSIKKKNKEQKNKEGRVDVLSNNTCKEKEEPCTSSSGEAFI